jgi:uncharacterized protein (TIGR02301 family)
MSPAAWLAAVLSMAGPTLAAAPVRPPDQRQTLVALAYVLGEAHALRTACRGAEDQVWRGRMSRMILVEQPDEGFRRRLVESFNNGFAGRQAQFPTCRPGAAGEERATAARGRELAQRLAAGGP